jgi:hypothetical protein
VDSGARTLALLSLLPTPLLVLGSAHELYLRNQLELEGYVSVLRPFWLGAIAAVAAGLVLAALRTRRWARAGWWAYQVAGAGFLLYSLLRALPWGDHLAAWVLDRLATSAVLVLVSLAAVARLTRLDPAVALKPLAAFAVLLAAQEAWRLGTRHEPPARGGTAATASPVLGGADADRPNVYQLVLDAYQPDHFDQAWPRGAPLDGFVYFREARSLYPATAPSMASLFTSRRQVAGPRHLQDALASPDALPRRLREAGYRTVAYVPGNVYPNPLEGFDAVVWHATGLAPEQARAMYRWLFPRLWAAVILPADLGDRLARAKGFGLSPEDLRQMRTLRASTPTQPLTTLSSFDRYLDQEAALPARGRYTLLHLLIPHDPFVLTEDCAFEPSRTNALSQSRCAALALQRFLRRLDELGRLRDSIVLVHSDHGAWSRERLDENTPALLLLKPAGASGVVVRRSEAASLLDVTPTLLAMVGVAASPRHEGRDLLGQGREARVGLDQ